MSDSRFLPDEETTLAFGACLAAAIQEGGIIMLRGDLGSGKTTLTAACYAHWATRCSKSPTIRWSSPMKSAHANFSLRLYRLNDPSELEYLGLRDFIDAQTLTLIEWPEKGGACCLKLIWTWR